MSAGYKEIETIEELDRLCANLGVISKYAFQGIDLSKASNYISFCKFCDCIFIGCHIPESYNVLISDSCIVFPHIDKPYRVFPSKLYNAESLYAGYSKTIAGSFDYCYDSVVYRYYQHCGKHSADILETFSRALHDTSIRNAMNDMLARYDEKQVVGVMGGHGMLRTDKVYADVVKLSKTLTEQGKLLVSGGGPGAMEATHLGAWLAGRNSDEVEDALRILSVAPSYKDEEWLCSAFEVMEKYPQNEYRSLGIPTWLYGHEPSAAFATDIAKFFDNSIREDGLLTIAKGGIVYTPGSAGTMQEIFQDANQNHYLTFGYSSPMVFLGERYWTDDIPIYSLLRNLLSKGKYKNLLLSITDSVDDAADTILKFGK